MKGIIQEVSKREDVRNMSAILVRIIDIVEQYHKQYPAIVEAEKPEPKPKKNVTGNTNNKGKETKTD